MITNKVFIIGLPRTGTTSLCSFLLNKGLTVAHTAYCQQAFDCAQVIADTPIFHDFQQLDSYYPDSKFIYLQRNIEQWLPSIKQLLIRMHDNLLNDSGGFNPIIKRCYLSRFSPFNLENINNEEFLRDIYQYHQVEVQQYFHGRDSDLLTTNISSHTSVDDICDFLSLPKDNDTVMPHMNKKGKVTAWKDIKSDRKIASTHKGRPTPLSYFN